jgi:hypothetical protein
MQNTGATTHVVQTEAESGTKTGGAEEYDHGQASGGTAVRFGTASSPNPQNPPPLRTVNVSSAAQLIAALSAAQAGDHIVMADGTYNGNFKSTASGTAAAPIVLRGGRGAVIDGGTENSSYAFQLGTRNSANRVSYWRLEGITIKSSKKGIIWDNVQHSVIDGVFVTDTEEEGIHLRNFSSDNIIRNSKVTLAGRVTQGFGEGIYIGTAYSNWENSSQGKPDRSDRNKVLNNEVSNTGAESIDIKEATSGGVISGNVFDGSGMCWNTGITCNFADSVMDMKGRDYVVSGNTVRNVNVRWNGDTPENDGFQVHAISQAASEGSGTNNTFSGNVFSSVGGYGINIAGGSGNVVKCDNAITGGKGLSNIGCRQ